MKRFLIILPFLLLSSCANTDSEKNLSVKLNDVEYNGNSLVLHLFFERPDLNLQQPISENKMEKSDLPKELVVDKVTLSEIDSDKDFAMDIKCETDMYPVTCRINFSQEDYVSFANEMPSRKFSVTAKFNDGFESDTTVLVPFISPYNLDYPKIIQPVEESKTKNILVFKDIGADKYFVDLSLCYKQDGDVFLNDEQCLKIPQYIVTKENNVFSVSFDENYFPAELNQRTDEIKLEFDMNPSKYDFIFYKVSTPQAVKTFLGTWFKFELKDEIKVSLI